MEKLRLMKPFMYNGEKLTEIEYDLESVTPAQYKAIIKRLQRKGHVVNMPELDGSVQQEYFAAATALQIPATELNNLHIRDYMRMEQLVRAFFLTDSDGETGTMEETETEMEDTSG
jgi:hypothetical protein